MEIIICNGCSLQGTASASSAWRGLSPGVAHVERWGVHDVTLRVQLRRQYRLTGLHLTLKHAVGGKKKKGYVVPR